MSTQFQFQDPGEGIAEAEVLEILVSQGDRVSEGDNVFVVETDKAAFDLASPFDGIVEEVLVGEGDQIKVGDALLRYTEGSESTADAAEDASDEAEYEAEDDSNAAESESSGGSQDDGSQHDGTEEAESHNGRERGSRPQRGRAERPVAIATPATRRLARELEVDLKEVDGSGDGGRVLAEDVRTHAAGGDVEEGEPQDKSKQGKALHGTSEGTDSKGKERVALRSVRRRTAERMAESWRWVARVTHDDRADITEIEGLRQRLAPAVEAAGAKLTLTTFVLKAVGAALKEHPKFNATYDDEAQELLLDGEVNVGVAVDTDRGLLVPVVADVPGSSLHECAVEVARLAERARDRKLELAELTNGTFTVTNVGSIGGTGLTPMVNPPQVAILGLARASLQSVITGTVDEHDSRVRLMLPLSLSFDHRVVDGAEAARFVRRVVELLEDADNFMLNT
jgi:pyruvate dehydrogenase E2 component (dihydrolipoamide acetyltransferase)